MGVSEAQQGNGPSLVVPEGAVNVRVMQHIVLYALDGKITERLLPPGNHTMRHVASPTGRPHIWLEVELDGQRYCFSKTHALILEDIVLP